MSLSAQSNPPAAAAYAPFAQLIKMLLPSARSVILYDTRRELVWCSDGYERPELRALLEVERAGDEKAARGSVETTTEGTPVFVSALRGAGGQPLGSLIVELGGGNSRSTPSMVVSMLRPVLDCLESQLDLQRSTLAADRSAGLDLLLQAERQSHEETSTLQELLNHCAKELRCVTGALIVPDKNLELSWTADAASAESKLLDRTQKHLLAWVRLNNRPMVVNRPGAGAAYKILSCPLHDPNGGVLGLLALFRSGSAEDFEPRDVRILEFVGRKALAILDSEYDALTGLPNRLIFERRAQRALDRAAASVLYADIDELNAINAAFGLSAGDEVIQRVAALIQREAGGDALVSRLAGDRFAVALPQGGVDGSAVATKILDAVGQLGYLNGTEAMQVSVSIGAAQAPAGERLQHVLAAAELACKRAKADGGARVAIIDDLAALTPAAARQAIAATDLRDALASNQFELDAQPIVRLGTRGAIAGYELLVRLRNSAGELVSPDKFLEACAQYGLLPALDRWVLCAAVEALRPHAQSIASAPFFFAVNVSAQSLQSRRYAAFALETLAAASLPPRLFCFEIKEPAAVADLAGADALIRELTNAGAKVALDDFGSGLSSIAHLKQLPVSYLKIDGEFVRRIGTDRVAESIVSGIARAARMLGIGTIAEHVETAGVAERLRELDVTLGQGFYFARPQSFVETVRLAVATPAPAEAKTRA